MHKAIYKTIHKTIKGQLLFIITISFLFTGSVNAAQQTKKFGPVKKGYSIWLIAKKTRPQGISHEQMMNALFKLNPTAFENGDINRLEVGSTLNLPSSKQDVLDILSGKSIQSAGGSKSKEPAKTAQSTVPTPISENTKSAISAIKAAKAAQTTSKKLNFEWRDMGKMLKNAEKLVAEGKNDKAEAIANMIIRHAEQAKAQAKLAKSAEPQFKVTPLATTKEKQVVAAPVVATATIAVKKTTEDKPKEDSTTTGSDDMFKAAENAQAVSKKLNFEWRDMGKMLKKAEKLASDGQADEAKGVADMIIKHAEQAKIQAELAKSAGPLF